jgi:cellulose synthase/poly-beta-1,6-N-acetylglucosamine synthase-like glycosyltransferase
LIESEFDNDFAQWKNFLNSHCKGEWIFQLDADEYLTPDLIVNMEALLDSNTDKDMIVVPRINTVEGLTESHIQKWGWPITKMETQIGEKEIDTESDEYKFLKKLGYIIEETKIL